MMRLPRTLAALSLAALVAGCGAERTDLDNFLLSGLAGLFQRGQDGPSLRERLTPEVLATIEGAILLVELPQIEAEAGAQIIRAEGNTAIWSTLNQIHFAFKSGVLTSTKGLAGDLIAADLGQVVPAVRSGRREAVRVHRYLDGNDQVITRAFVCTYSRAPGQTTSTLTATFRATLVTERCNSTGLEIENQYWIDGAGTVRKSKQWIGPFPGYVLTEQIKD